MASSTQKYWRFQCRALLTRVGLWGPFERWRLRQRFQRGIAHEPDFAFFRHFADSNQLFVDIGANLGQSALSFRLANRSASILSFEPNPDMAPALRVVKELLGASFDFRLHGLGARTEERPLFVPIVKGVPFPQCATFQRECLVNNPSVRQLFHEWTHTDQFEIVERAIQLVRFDELGLDPAFVKIDVEGGEHEVVAGMEETLKRCRPLVITEGCGAQTLLTQFGYQTFVHEPAGNTLRLALSGESAPNVFYVPAEKITAFERIGALQCSPARRAA